MRVRCLPPSVRYFYCNITSAVIFALLIRQSTTTPALSPMIPSDIANLKRSIEVLREVVGNSVNDIPLYFSSLQNHVNKEVTSGHSKGESIETAAILNVKADIRTMTRNDSDQLDIETDSVERLMLADRASHHKTRHLKNRRRKGCVASKHGHKQMLCPTRSSHRYDVCITIHQLCDDVIDCPGGEDENPTNCFFYRSTKEQLRHIYNTVLLLADHATKQTNNREL